MEQPGARRPPRPGHLRVVRRCDPDPIPPRLVAYDVLACYFIAATFGVTTVFLLGVHYAWLGRLLELFGAGLVMYGLVAFLTRNGK